jgi:hypothetical protein
MQRTDKLLDIALFGLGLSAVTYAAASAVETGAAFLRLTLNSPDSMFLGMKHRLDEIKDGLRELEAKQDELLVYLTVSKTPAFSQSQAAQCKLSSTWHA